MSSCFASYYRTLQVDLVFTGYSEFSSATCSLAACTCMCFDELFCSRFGELGSDHHLPNTASPTHFYHVKKFQPEHMQATWAQLYCIDEGKSEFRDSSIKIQHDIKWSENSVRVSLDGVSG